MKSLFYLFISISVVLIGCQAKSPKYEIVVNKAAENGFMNLFPCEMLINGKPAGSIKSEETKKFSVSSSDICISVRSQRWEPDAKGGVDYDVNGKEIHVYSNIESLESSVGFVYVIKAVRSGVGNCCDHMGWEITKEKIH